MIPKPDDEKRPLCITEVGMNAKAKENMMV